MQNGVEPRMNLQAWVRRLQIGGLNEGRSILTVQRIPLTELAIVLAQQAAYDESFYLKQYPDVEKAIARGVFKTGREHFLQFGFLEGRCGSLEHFDARAYYDANPDLQKVFKTFDADELRKHYLDMGCAEGRFASAEDQALLPNKN